MDRSALETWFKAAVLPLETGLVRYISRKVSADEVMDVRQEVYERALRGGQTQLPASPRNYIFAIARNVLIDRARRGKIVSFEQFADLDDSYSDAGLDGVERQMDARHQLRRVMAGLDNLPARCREVVRLRKVEGLSTRETASRLGVSHHTVERQLTLGIRALADFLLGGDGRIRRSDTAARRRRSNP